MLHPVGTLQLYTTGLLLGKSVDRCCDTPSSLAGPHTSSPPPEVSRPPRRRGRWRSIAGLGETAEGLPLRLQEWPRPARRLHPHRWVVRLRRRPVHSAPLPTRPATVTSAGPQAGLEPRRRAEAAPRSAPGAAGAGGQLGQSGRRRPAGSGRRGQRRKDPAGLDGGWAHSASTGRTRIARRRARGSP